MSTLENQRQKLLETTKNIFELLCTRSSIVAEIQTIKADQKKMIWSAAQELKVFKSLKSELVSCDLKELLQFSLIIEIQASKGSHYPSWSTGEHLESSVLKLSHQINPILLFLYNSQEYAKLDLSEKFAKTLEELIKSER